MIVRYAVVEDAVRIRLLEADIVRIVFPNPTDPADADRIGRIADTWVSSDGLAEFADLFGRQLNDSEHLWLVSESCGTLTGFIHGLKESNTARIQGLYVDHRWQGCGVADRLLDWFDAWSSGLAASLAALAHNSRAIRFYTRHGFILDPPGSCPIPGVVTMSRR